MGQHGLAALAAIRSSSGSRPEGQNSTLGSGMTLEISQFIVQFYYDPLECRFRVPKS